MQWLVLIWAVFVLAIYIGGFFFPESIGVHTPDSGKIYAAFLLTAVATSVLRAMATRESGKA